MGFNYFDNRMMRILNLGLPSLSSVKWLDIIDELSAEKPYSYLGLKHFPDLAELALHHHLPILWRDVDPELRSFFEKLYSKPEMTDLYGSICQDCQLEDGTRKTRDSNDHIPAGRQ